MATYFTGQVTVNMPRMCVIKGCRSTASEKDAGVKFYSFPNEKRTILDDEEKQLASRRRKLWLERAEFVESDINSASKVCSKHFVNGKYSFNFTNFFEI